MCKTRELDDLYYMTVFFCRTISGKIFSESFKKAALVSLTVVNSPLL